MIRRNRGKFIAASLVLIALLAGVIGTTIGLVGPAKQRRVAEQQMKLAEQKSVEAQQNADEAHGKMKVARAVSQFQTDMLADADPSRSLGEKLTVMQAMRSAERVLDDGQLQDQPMAESAVRQTIGYTYLGLGQLDPALRSLEKALSLRRAISGHAPAALAIFQKAYPPEHYRICNVVSNIRRGTDPAAELR